MKNQESFTLIELLVVVAIIAVLVAVLLPALTAARDQAKLVTCGAHVRGVVAALVMYAGENADRFPLADGQSGTDCWDMYLSNTSDKRFSYWAVLKGGMLADPKLLYCPADSLNYETNFPPRGNYVSYPYRGVTTVPPEPRYQTYNFSGPDGSGDEVKGMLADRFMWSPSVHQVHRYNVGYSDGSVLAVLDAAGLIWNEQGTGYAFTYWGRVYAYSQVFDPARRR